MEYLFKSLVVVVFIVGIFQILSTIPRLVEELETPKQYMYYDTGALRVADTCVSTSEQFPYWSVKVIVAKDIGIEGAVGYWSPSKGLIVLKEKGGTDVDTVAHEVYHMVEDVMDWYEITDPHVGAYLQGNWTKCVLEVVQHQGQFRFAD